MTGTYRRKHTLVARLMAVALVLMPLSALAQTKISYHSNKYSIQDDVKLGRQAAAEAERQFPILRDEETTQYVERVGQRLVDHIPPQFQHPEFRYYFKVVNARDINAFALPGGPMYVNRGMIEAARTEGEMAGVMAHELAHVALRHGTAQATKAQKYSILAGVIGITGAILAGPAAGQLGQAAVGTYFLKYSREYETEADILGAQIMANAGYHPRDLANMFKTIEQHGGSRGGPQWLNSHPNPKNRYARITQEAALLRVSENPIQDTAEFNRVRSRLSGMGRAPSMEEIARGGGGGGQRYPQDNRGGRYPDQGRIGVQVPYPSSRYRTYTAGNLFRVSVPENWRELPSNDSVWFAPEGAYGQNVYTHGVNLGITRAQSSNLRQATSQLVNSLAQESGNMRPQTDYVRGDINGREALGITLTNVNEATGRTEIVIVYTTMLRNGNLFYVIALAPQSDWNNYEGVFQNILRTIQING